MNEQAFYSAVGATDFSERYYALCRRYSVRDVAPCQLSNRTITDLLSGLNRRLKRNTRDNSYQCDRTFRRGVAHIGFVIQAHAMVEFWFWLDQVSERIGSNYAVIAYESAKLSGKSPSEATYPRPEFHSENELRVILAESFGLADQLMLIVQTHT